MGDENAKNLPLRGRKLLEHASIMVVIHVRGNQKVFSVGLQTRNRESTFETR